MAKKKKTKRIVAKKKRTKRIVHDIGIIHSGTSGRHGPHMKAFDDGMAVFSNATHRNPRWAKDNHGALDAHATDLISAGVTILVAAGGSRSAIAAMGATVDKAIVVTSVSNPVRPAANVAGICARTTEHDVDRLQKLLDLKPGAKKIGVLYNPSRPDTHDQRARLDTKAGLLGIDPLNYQPVDPNGSSQESQIDSAFKYWEANTYEAVLVAADPLFNNHIDRIVRTSGGALRALPAIYQWREFAEAGGLMSYGPSLTLAYKLAGYFVGRIASHETTEINKLPLLPLDSCELVINLRTAKELNNIYLPPTLLALANDVIV